MNPATALTEVPDDTTSAVEADVTLVEPHPHQVQPHPAEWYDTGEFRRQLLLHFQKACRTAVASNPQDLPG